MSLVEVDSPNVVYTSSHIESKYRYQATAVSSFGGKIIATPTEAVYSFRTERTVPKVGCMFVGWGGNNGSTVTAAVLANKLGMTWRTKEGIQHSNYYGSITQASTIYLGSSGIGDVFVPFCDLLPMLHPNELVFDGISCLVLFHNSI